MRLAIMQPYLFPYVGYFQLVANVDKFIFYNDVNYIKSGWINRNRLIFEGKPQYFTIPLMGASSFLKINQILVQPNHVWRRKILNSIRFSYSHAPNYTIVNDIICDVLASNEIKISDFASRSIIAVSKYLGLKTEFLYSSLCHGNSTLKGVERIIGICNKEGATQYYNLPGGKALYDDCTFNAHGIELKFITPNLTPYEQCSPVFIPGLSIIDVLMHNDISTVMKLLLKEAELP